MSYILDALSKLERKRLRGSVPDLFSVLEPPRRRPKRRRPWIILIVSLLAVGAIGLATWRHPWKPAGLETPPQAVIGQASPPDGSPIRMKPGTPLVIVNATPSSPPVEEVRSDKSRPSAESAPLPPRMDTGVGTPQREAPRQARMPASPPAASRAAAPTAISPVEAEQQGRSPSRSAAPPLVAAPAPAPSPEAGRDSGSETPPEEQPKVTAAGNEPSPGENTSGPPLEREAAPKEIRDLVVSGHVFSEEPGMRMIIINNRIMKERDSFGDGITVEAITSDGALLGYRGSRYRLPASD